MGQRTIEAPAVAGLTLEAQEQLNEAGKQRLNDDLATHANRTMTEADFEKWLQQNIQVRIMSTETDRSDVSVSVNGERFDIPRNKWVSIPRYIEAALNNAVVETKRTEVNPINPLFTIVVDDVQVRFPFQTTADGPSAREFYETREMREMVDENLRLAAEAAEWERKFEEAKNETPEREEAKESKKDK